LCTKYSDHEIRFGRTLINFAVLILEIAESLPETKGSSHLSGQLVRCGTAPALHYGEAQSAESRKDFIHKMKIALKEMRESLICLKIIERKKYLTDPSIVNSLSELNELISIFVKSIKTAKTNMNIEYRARNIEG
jgi:four helix bundle protein